MLELIAIALQFAGAIMTLLTVLSTRKDIIQMPKWIRKLIYRKEEKNSLKDKRTGMLAFVGFAYLLFGYSIPLVRKEEIFPIGIWWLKELLFLVIVLILVIIGLLYANCKLNKARK